MADDRDDARRDERRPYTLYRARPRGLLERLRGEPSTLEELRAGARGARGAADPGPSPGESARGGGRTAAEAGRAWPRPRRGRRRLTPGRVLRWAALAVVGWLALSLVLFLISAQLESDAISDEAKAALDPAGYPLWSANTILLIGTDARPPGSKEPGANPGGPSRADTLMLWRIGGGRNARLSIPRDTVVEIPGHGRQKINAAQAFGGTALTIRTVEQYLGIPINHVIEVDFEHFPQLVDALGGVDVRTGRVCAKINGGRANGGVTLNLRRGTHRLNGRQALALARVRKNDCNPAENDLTRARRQQQILSAMKSRLLSPTTFARLPWVSWATPRTVRTDMGGPTLMGFLLAASLAGSPPVEVLRPSGGETLPDGGAGLVVDEATKQAAVRKLLDG